MRRVSSCDKVYSEMASQMCSDATSVLGSLDAVVGRSLCTVSTAVGPCRAARGGPAVPPAAGGRWRARGRMWVCCANAAGARAGWSLVHTEVGSRARAAESETHTRIHTFTHTRHGASVDMRMRM